MRKTVAAFAALSVLLLLSAGCAPKKIVTKPTPEEKKTEAVETEAMAKAKAEEAEKKKAEEEAAKMEMEKEKVTEETITSAEKKAETETTPVETIVEEKTIAEAKAVCTADTAGPDQRPTYDSVYFDYDSYTLTTAEAAKLGEFSAWLSKNSIKVYVEGHCDERGTTEYNLALGEKRASRIREFLTQTGVPAKRVEAVSCGEEQSVCEDKTEECFSKNRRARFVVIKDEKPANK